MIIYCRYWKRPKRRRPCFHKIHAKLFSEEKLGFKKVFASLIQAQLKFIGKLKKGFAGNVCGSEKWEKVPSFMRKWQAITMNPKDKKQT